MRIGESMLPEFDIEMAGTRKVLERLPNDKFDWKIHDKSNTIGWVANHLAEIPAWAQSIIHDDSFDVEPEPGRPHQSPTEETAEAVVALFDKNLVGAREALEKVEDARLFEPWSLTRGGEVLFTMPRLAVIRTWVLNHTIHHRAHLCVYLRVNDVPVPALYGPSADEDQM